MLARYTPQAFNLSIDTCEFGSCTEGVVSYVDNGMSAWSTYCSKRKSDVDSLDSSALSPSNSDKCCEDNCHLKCSGSNGNYDHKRCQYRKYIKVSLIEIFV